MTTTCTSAAPPRLVCTLLAETSQLEALRPAWSDLLARSDSNEPMSSPQWLLTWWDVFGASDGLRLRALALHDGDRLAGLAPFLSRRHWHRPGIPFRRLEPLGSGESEADAICSDYLNVLAERGADQAVAEAFAGAIAAGAAGPWDELVLPTMNGDDAMPSLLADAFRRLGFEPDLTATGEAPYIELPATWDDYLKSLSKKHRYSVVRSLRDFETWAGPDARLKRAVSRADLDQGKRILVELHRQRWEMAGNAGRFGSPRFLAFHEAVMPRLLDDGALELLWLTVRGEPVAAMYDIVWNDKVYFYQSGRKMDVPEGIRPGGVLLAYAIRAAIEAGRREFDFLNGVSLYKTQLATVRRPIVQLRVVRRCLVERLRRAAEAGIGVLRGCRRRTHRLRSANKGQRRG
jgi:CelD/BcsL family acetyltransferase involved in cellulose biosynthesis